VSTELSERNTQHASRVTHHASRATYFIWTIGCQMNRADSRRAAAALEALGYAPAVRAEEADLVVLNSCVVRQSAEDKAIGRLSSLRSLKQRRPGAAVVLMGCLVGDIAALQARFPHVDLFVRPSDVEGLVGWVEAHMQARCEAAQRRRGRGGEISSPQEGGKTPPSRGGKTPPLLCALCASAVNPVSAEVAAILGCDRHCTYCLVRLRRGPCRSRTVEEIVAEVEALVRSGVREITLLGQSIDAYGRDLQWDGLSSPSTSDQPAHPWDGLSSPSTSGQPAHPWDGLSSPSARLRDTGTGSKARPTLAGLLRLVHDIPGLARLRFLTSHPADLEDEVIDAVAELPRLCPHWELPVQAGDDEVLRRMARGYTVAEYLALVARIRARLPQASIATDVIVGFPGETAEQFERTMDLLRAVRFDAVHVASYSVRPGTPAARLADDVQPEEKERRRRAVEALQEEIVGQINARLLGQEVEVLVEELHKGKWKGRTASNKLVFFEDGQDWLGRLARVLITKTGPWSLQGRVQ